MNSRQTTKDQPSAQVSSSFHKDSKESERERPLRIVKPRAVEATQTQREPHDCRPIGGG